jgi:hypothetical protein
MVHDEIWWLELPDNTRIPFEGHGYASGDADASPSVVEVFGARYPTGPVMPVASDGSDPGRVRLEPLMRLAYGATPAEVESALVTVVLRGEPVRIHRKVAEPLRRVSSALEAAVRADPSLDKFLHHLGGTYNWRHVAGTERMSAHAWAIAVDLDPALGDYWRNGDRGAPRWRNRIPQPIVDAFEANGFIWGGRWAHYDTMHFEYRPELLDANCYPAPSNE